LARVKESEGCGDFDGGFFVRLEGGVVASDLVLFVVEVLLLLTAVM
jgi:hypothetical protein